ncbi:MAG: hypothetical protein KatS3mg082_1226 [Nitrospiraceae bacterium]|nr:MAG: hypothetical protein KatS3mg082_1226 [Nitrospiraceae bacterium]
MKRSLLGSTTWVLVVTVVTVLAATTGSVVAHDFQHAAHHAAGLHSTGICAWMCAAGQVFGEIPFVLHVDVGPLTFGSLPFFREPSETASQAPASRGPPVFPI